MNISRKCLRILHGLLFTIIAWGFLYIFKEKLLSLKPPVTTRFFCCLFCYVFLGGREEGLFDLIKYCIHKHCRGYAYIERENSGLLGSEGSPSFSFSPAALTEEYSLRHKKENAIIYSFHILSSIPH